MDGRRVKREDGEDQPHWTGKEREWHGIVTVQLSETSKNRSGMGQGILYSRSTKNLLK